MTKRWDQVRPEVAQRLMAAVDEHLRNFGIPCHHVGSSSIELMSCLEMARAEAAPKLRTRAEVEHEIADLLLYNTRSWGGLEQQGGVFIRFLKGSGNDRKLSELCVELADIRKTEESAEPLAPEPKQPGEDRDVGIDDGTTPAPCSCEEALALRKRLGKIKSYLDSWLACEGDWDDIRRAREIALEGP